MLVSRPPGEPQARTTQLNGRMRAGERDMFGTASEPSENLGKQREEHDTLRRKLDEAKKTAKEEHEAATIEGCFLELCLVKNVS